MTAARSTARAIAGYWLVFLALYYIRETWRGIPGPWPVKMTLVVICFAIPGWFDEWALLKLAQWNGKRKEMRTA